MIWDELYIPPGRSVQEIGLRPHYGSSADEQPLERRPADNLRHLRAHIRVIERLLRAP